MSGVAGVFLSADEHPFRAVAEQIWGINIVRTARDAKEAPASIATAFKAFRTAPVPVRCGCCGEEGRSKGLAVLRVHPPANMPDVSMIPFGICGKCLREPDDSKLTPRIFKMLTGYDRPTKTWKEMQN